MKSKKTDARSAGSLRDEMPETAAFIDAMRIVFGKQHVDEQIRRGLRGEPTFWARENGREIGTKPVVRDER